MNEVSTRTLESEWKPRLGCKAQCEIVAHQKTNFNIEINKNRSKDHVSNPRITDNTYFWHLGHLSSSLPKIPPSTTIKIFHRQSFFGLLNSSSIGCKMRKRMRLTQNMVISSKSIQLFGLFLFIIFVLQNLCKMLLVKLIWFFNRLLISVM